MESLFNSTCTNQPVWIRLPKAGERCAYTGLSRAALYALATTPEGEPRVVSRQLKILPSSSRGVRLINLQSLLNHIANSELKN